MGPDPYGQRLHGVSIANAYLLLRANPMDPPAKLVGLGAFMNYVRGMAPMTCVLAGEPDTQALALTVELRADSYLELVWQISR